MSASETPPLPASIDRMRERFLASQRASWREIRAWREPVVVDVIGGPLDGLKRVLDRQPTEGDAFGWCDLAERGVLEAVYRYMSGA